MKRKTKKVLHNAYKRVCEKLFSTNFQWHLFHLTVSLSFILTVRHVWHWLDGFVVGFGVCFFLFRSNFIVFRCAATTYRTIKTCQRMKRVKRLRASCSIIHNFLSSKCIYKCTHSIRLYMHTIQIQIYQVKKSSIESQHSHHHHTVCH